ncbi:MAG: hypothetical protein RhofKO_40610 [Rhodothermales bacterium]
MRLFLTLFLATLSVPGFAQAPGDIAIIGMNTDDPDQFAFVALAPLTAGTDIRFTDRGWTRNNAFRDGEGVFTYTVPDAGLYPGAVVVIVEPAGLDLSSSGDQLFAYIGSEEAPSFLYGLNASGAPRSTPVWQRDATNDNTSDLPSALSNWTTAVAVTERDNVGYNGPTSGTRTSLLAAIGNRENWQGSNIETQTFVSTFDVYESGNQPPIFSQPFYRSLSVRADVEFDFLPRASDPEGDTVTFELVSGPGSVELVNGRSIYLWTPTVADIGDSFEIVIRATDGEDSAFTSGILSVVPKGMNNPPYFDAASVGEYVQVGKKGILYFALTDLDKDELTLQVVEGPHGSEVFIDPERGTYRRSLNARLEFTPPQVGVYRFLVRVSDGYEGSYHEFVVGIAGIEPDWIMGDLTGEALRRAIAKEYGPRQTLSYENAVDTLFARIANRGASTGPYAGLSVQSIFVGWSLGTGLGEDPSAHMANSNLYAEPIWPASMGADEVPQRSDLHVLYPTLAHVASARGALPFGSVDSSDTKIWFSHRGLITEPQSRPHHYSRLSDQLFEPSNHVKGDVARAMFYFWTMYPEVVDNVFFAQQAETLIEWNEQDPADRGEVARSARIQHYQGNPNPFILDTSLMRRMWMVSQSASEEQAEAVQLELFPNPVQDQATLVLTQDVAASDVHIEVFDMLGRRVHATAYPRMPSGTHRLHVDVSRLAPGAYAIRATLNDTKLIKPFVVLK